MKIKFRYEILFAMLNCPDCNIKPGTKDSTFCKNHLREIMEDNKK